MLVVAVLMAAGIASAQSGTGWEYDETTRTLTLSGDKIDEIDWSYRGSVEHVVFAKDFSVAELPSSVFLLLSSLKEIEIPDCVTSIGDNAFSGCSSFSFVSLPDGIQSIGVGAFSWCEDLTSVSLPASLKRIGDGAFGCNSLKVVKVLSDETSENEHCILLGDSDDKTATGKNVFPKGQATLVYDEGKTWIGDSDTENLRSYFNNFFTSTEVTNKGWKYDAATKTLTLSGDEVAWHEFADYAQITEKVVFDETFKVASIGINSFSDFIELTEVKIPDCVTSIGNRAFWNCSSLTSVSLPDGIQSIGVGAFSWCEGLTSVSLPATLKYIGHNAFNSCYMLGTVIMKSNGTPEKKHYVLLGDDNTEDKAATGSCVFPQGQATLLYDPNTTWIGDNNKQNLLYYFDGHMQETALDIPSITTTPAQYYDLGGRRVNVENNKGVVVKVENGKSELMMVK